MKTPFSSLLLIWNLLIPILFFTSYAYIFVSNFSGIYTFQIDRLLTHKSCTINVGSQYQQLLVATSSNANSTNWCVDSGASIHLCCDINFFKDIDLNADVVNINGVSKETIRSAGKGTIKIPVKDKNTNELFNFVLHNVYYVLRFSFTGRTGLEIMLRCKQLIRI